MEGEKSCGKGRAEVKVDWRFHWRAEMSATGMARSWRFIVSEGRAKQGVPWG